MWHRFSDWLTENPLHRHIGLAPGGSLVATWLMLGLAGAGWSWWADAAALERAGQVFPMGAGVYGTLAALIDGGFKMIFFALAQRRQEIERRREEGRQVGRTEGREELIRELVDRGVSLPDDVRKGIEKDGKGP